MTARPACCAHPAHHHRPWGCDHGWHRLESGERSRGCECDAPYWQGKPIEGRR